MTLGWWKGVLLLQSWEDPKSLCPASTSGVEDQVLISTSSPPGFSQVSSSLTSACLRTVQLLFSSQSPGDWPAALSFIRLPSAGTARSFRALLFSCLVWLFHLGGFPGLIAPSFPSPIFGSRFSFSLHCTCERWMLSQHRKIWQKNYSLLESGIWLFWLLFYYAWNWRFSMKSCYSESKSSGLWPPTACVVLKWCSVGRTNIWGLRERGKKTVASSQSLEAYFKLWFQVSCLTMRFILEESLEDCVKVLMCLKVYVEFSPKSNFINCWCYYKLEL